MGAYLVWYSSVGSAVLISSADFWAFSRTIDSSEDDGIIFVWRLFAFRILWDKKSENMDDFNSRGGPEQCITACKFECIQTMMQEYMYLAHHFPNTMTMYSNKKLTDREQYFEWFQQGMNM